MSTKMKWKCGQCGFIHDGDDAPGSCPKCGAKADVFALLDEDAAILVERSRRSNTLLCRLVDLGRQMEWLCREGIEDDLDPSCVDVFEKSLVSSWEIMKLAMTEMQGHAAKGKWG